MDLEKTLNKKYGACMINPRDIIDRDTTIFPVSPALDIALSGGIPEGSWVLISGKQKLGKSSLALEIIATAQKEEYGSRPCYYFDVEGRLKKMNLEGIKSLDIDKMKVFRSQEDNLLDGQAFLRIAEDIVKNVPNAVVVIDSASALCTSRESESDLDSNYRSDAPKLMAGFTRRLANVVPIRNTLLIVIQHLIANTSGYGPTQMEDGGRKIQYQADVKLTCKTAQPWEDGGKQIGNIIKWEVPVSALGPPNQKCDGYLRFGYGVDKLWETINIAVDLDIIKKGGAWFTLPNEQKFQGQPKLYAHLSEHPEEVISIQKTIKEMFG